MSSQMSSQNPTNGTTTTTAQAENEDVLSINAPLLIHYRTGSLI